MEIDIRRWTGLLDELAVLRAESQGIGQAIFEVDGRLGRARAEFGRIVDRRPRELGARPSSTLEELREAARPNPDPRVPYRPDAVQYDLLYLEAERQLQAVEAEFRLLDGRRSALHQKANELSNIEQRCRRWGRERGIQLPGGDEKTSVIVPASGPGREHASSITAAPTTAAQRSTAPAAEGRARSNGLFAMFGGRT
jgi:hypothetical protein